MDILLWIFIFVAGIAILIKSAGYFVSAAEKVGVFLGISPFIVGITIVAIGTSLPELISSLVAVFKDSSEIVIGTVVGSNVANILLILGVVAVLSKKTIKITYELVHVDLPLLVGSAFLLAAMAFDGVFSLFEGILALSAAVLYVYFTVSSQKGSTEKPKREKLKIKTIAILAVSSVFIYIGAKFTIDSVIVISDFLHIGKEIIAASAVALGTSLPELTVSIMAARKGNSELAVGNILGSNIFNTLAVMGVPALIAPLLIPQSILIFALPVMVMATLLYFFVTQDKQITKWEGWFLIIFYIFFIWKLF